jgi:Cd(II)/Pb(II)-responsive transcriptional regulator
VRIGELARRGDITPETVRYYERLGFLPAPDRTEGNYRDYDETHLDRLRFIRNCRAVGMTLEEVHRLLYFRDRPNLACHEINNLLDAHIDRVEEQLRELQLLGGYLRELRSCCETPRTAGDCGIMARLNERQL